LSSEERDKSIDSEENSSSSSPSSAPEDGNGNISDRDLSNSAESIVVPSIKRRVKKRKLEASDDAYGKQAVSIIGDDMNVSELEQRFSPEIYSIIVDSFNRENEKSSMLLKAVNLSR
jgi:hypothetical protein